MGRLQSLPTNSRLRWNWLPVKDTLAYYDIELITAVKILVEKPPDNLSAYQPKFIGKNSFKKIPKKNKFFFKFEIQLKCRCHHNWPKANPPKGTLQKGFKVALLF